VLDRGCDSVVLLHHSMQIRLTTAHPGFQFGPQKFVLGGMVVVQSREYEGQVITDDLSPRQVARRNTVDQI
jgi:hypothetical protein